MEASVSVGQMWLEEDVTDVFRALLDLDLVDADVCCFVLNLEL